MDRSSNQYVDEEPEASQRGSSNGGGREITLEVLLNATKLSVGKRENLSHYLKRITHLALNGDASKMLEKGGNVDGAIRKIQNLHHCPNLKVLYLYDNEVEMIENLDAVPQLTQLHLQGNCLRRMENLDPLKLLEKLYLEKNAISRLEGLRECPRLQELHLANQAVPMNLEFSFEEETMWALAVRSDILSIVFSKATATDIVACVPRA
ncbi:hypothetical protein PHYBOEH_011044 [Phytophthora boehmeriae]|uniref:Uncharacterized protein n=1 Tax=Phytophthora boehmeriae TaxID=109152 RepID=A0A8T1X6X3_9STRA|nr:hypothetical protein PHYBOEH_011044 [Phytophthora boehmeriae]